jgi:hypothetical protein
VHLSQIEEQLGVGSMASALVRKLRYQVPYVGRIVDAHGNDSSRREFKRLEDQYQRYADADDPRGLKWIHEQIWLLHWVVVDDQIWYWREVMANLKRPGERFVNREEAMKVIAEGERAQEAGDLRGLRSACLRAWALQPKEQVEAAKEQAAQSGLRGT